jgi:hypothetical protein
MAQENDFFQAEMVQKGQNVSGVNIDGISGCRFVRKPPAPEVHGQETMAGRNRAGNRIPASAIRRQPVNG